MSEFSIWAVKQAFDVPCCASHKNRVMLDYAVSILQVQWKDIESNYK